MQTRLSEMLASHRTLRPLSKLHRRKRGVGRIASEQSVTSWPDGSFSGCAIVCGYGEGESVWSQTWTRIADKCAAECAETCDTKSPQMQDL